MTVLTDSIILCPSCFRTISWIIYIIHEVAVGVWVLEAIDGCELYLNRHRKTFYDRPYFVLPDYPEIRRALWFPCCADGRTREA